MYLQKEKNSLEEGQRQGINIVSCVVTGWAVQTLSQN